MKVDVKRVNLGHGTQKDTRLEQEGRLRQRKV